MLIYMNGGMREWNSNPLPCYVRRLWEFHAVVQGGCAPVFPGAMPASFSSRTLWLFSPGVSHGWMSPEGPPCEVLGFHFDQVPDTLRNIVGDHYLTLDLTARDVRFLRHLQQRLHSDYRNPTQMSTLHVQKALLELSIMMLRDHPAIPISRDETYAHHITQQALSWFTEHLGANPSVTEVAESVNVSPAYLRRLFHQATGQSPHTLFQRVQIERAVELLTNSDLPIKSIAKTCGIPDPATFSRLFQRVVKLAPREFRSRYVNGRGLLAPSAKENAG